MSTAVVTPELVKPKLRGVSHQIAAFVAGLATVGLVIWAGSTRARLAAGIYGFGLTAMYAVSALYHRPTWQPRARMWMRRLDHATIFLLIAATYTPIGIYLWPNPGKAVLLLGWAGAVAGMFQSVFWVHAPKPVSALLYVALGWGSVAFIPSLAARAGMTSVVLLAAGGVIFSMGALVYALKRPNPAPRVFGYHEIFHALVIVASACHFLVEVRVLGLMS